MWTGKECQESIHPGVYTHGYADFLTPYAISQVYKIDHWVPSLPCWTTGWPPMIRWWTTMLTWLFSNDWIAGLVLIGVAIPVVLMIVAILACCCIPFLWALVDKTVHALFEQYMQMYLYVTTMESIHPVLEEGDKFENWKSAQSLMLFVCSVICLSPCPCLSTLSLFWFKLCMQDHGEWRWPTAMSTPTALQRNVCHAGAMYQLVCLHALSSLPVHSLLKTVGRSGRLRWNWTPVAGPRRTECTLLLAFRWASSKGSAAWGHLPCVIPSDPCHHDVYQWNVDWPQVGNGLSTQ